MFIFADPAFTIADPVFNFADRAFTFGWIRRSRSPGQRKHGFLDISTFRPDPAYGHAIATVDGQLQKVLFSHQILCGKLERVDHLLVRHVFDVLTAVDEDPAAPKAPAGMVSQQRAAFIESVWREAAGMLAGNFHDAIRGAGRSVGTGLGRRTR